jgi:hypothetical protein
MLTDFRFESQLYVWDRYLESCLCCESYFQKKHIYYMEESAPESSLFQLVTLSPLLLEAIVTDDGPIPDPSPSWGKYATQGLPSYQGSPPLVGGRLSLIPGLSGSEGSTRPGFLSPSVSTVTPLAARDQGPFSLTVVLSGESPGRYRHPTGSLGRVEEPIRVRQEGFLISTASERCPT